MVHFSWDLVIFHEIEAAVWSTKWPIWLVFDWLAPLILKDLLKKAWDSSIFSEIHFIFREVSLMIFYKFREIRWIFREVDLFFMRCHSIDSPHEMDKMRNPNIKLFILDEMCKPIPLKTRDLTRFDENCKNSLYLCTRILRIYFSFHTFPTIPYGNVCFPFKTIDQHFFIAFIFLLIRLLT